MVRTSGGDRARALGRRRGAAVAALAAALLLSACTATPEPEPEPEPLTTSEAGRVYLEAVCPVNDAWNEVDLEVDRLRIALARGEAEPPAPSGALQRLADASAEAARALASDELLWPADASDEIDAVRATLASDAEQARAVAELSSRRLAEYDWQGGEEAGAIAAEARAALGLPDDAELACARWAEQRAGDDGQTGDAPGVDDTDSGADTDDAPDTQDTRDTDSGGDTDDTPSGGSAEKPRR